MPPTGSRFGSPEASGVNAGACAQRAVKVETMRRLNVFNSISLDGFFTDAKNDMSFFHKSDPEWVKFSSENAQGGRGVLLFGRVTYELMASFWPTEHAKKQMPDVAEGMNRMEKIVCSRSLQKPEWSNTTLLKGDLVTEVRKLKAGSGDPILILGSGTVVSQLTQAKLIDAYTFVIVPMVLGAGRTMFEGVTERCELKRTSERAFQNGNIVATYERT